MTTPISSLSDSSDSPVRLERRSNATLKRRYTPSNQDLKARALAAASGYDLTDEQFQEVFQHFIRMDRFHTGEIKKLTFIQNLEFIGYDTLDADHKCNKTFGSKDVLKIEGFVHYMAPNVKRLPTTIQVQEIVDMYSTTKNNNSEPVLSTSDAHPVFDHIFHKHFTDQEEMRLCMALDEDFNGWIDPYELYEYIREVILCDDELDFNVIYNELVQHATNKNYKKKKKKSPENSKKISQQKKGLTTFFNKVQSKT